MEKYKHIFEHSEYYIYLSLRSVSLILTEVRLAYQKLL